MATDIDAPVGLNPDALVAPMAWDAFVGDVWDRDYRVFPATGDRSFESLFSRAAAEQLVSGTGYRSDALRMMQAGSILRPARYTSTYRGSTLLDPVKIERLYRGGATLEFNALERFWTPLDEFCTDLQARLGCPVGAGAFLSPAPHDPAAGRALDAHFDTMDLFILQVSGRKRWRFYETSHPRPLDDQTWSAERYTIGALREEVVLEPGDSVYLMRGTVHDALTVDDHSLHLAISVYPFRLYDALLAAVTALADDARFRTALPPGALPRRGSDGEGFDTRFDDLRRLTAELLSAEAAAEGLRAKARRFERDRPTISLGPAPD